MLWCWWACLFIYVHPCLFTLDDDEAEEEQKFEVKKKQGMCCGLCLKIIRKKKSVMYLFEVWWCNIVVYFWFVFIPIKIWAGVNFDSLWIYESCNQHIWIRLGEGSDKGVHVDNTTPEIESVLNQMKFDQWLWLDYTTTRQEKLKFTCSSEPTRQIQIEIHLQWPIRQRSKECGRNGAEIPDKKSWPVALPCVGYAQVGR